MATESKVFAKFENAFWGDTRNVYVVAYRKGYYPYWLSMKFEDGSAVLMGMLTGVEAERVEAMENKYINQFREIIRIFDREVSFQNSASCCNGISVAQCHTLLEIENNNEISISELAGNLSLDKSTVSRTVEGLVNINLRRFSNAVVVVATSVLKCLLSIR